MLESHLPCCFENIFLTFKKDLCLHYEAMSFGQRDRQQQKSESTNTLLVLVFLLEFMILSKTENSFIVSIMQ